MEDPDLRKVRYALAQLRHLYHHMLNDNVRDYHAAARGLLGPSIEKLEEVLTPYAAPEDATEARFSLLELE